MVITEELNKIPDSWKGHKFNQDEKLMLANGNYVFSNDFISNDGKTFPCNVKIDKSKEDKKGKYFIKANFDMR